MFDSAFNFIIHMQGRVMKLEDLETATEVDIKIATSNYFRNFSAPEEMVIEGREFIISKKLLDQADPTFPGPKRNTRITDPELGSGMTITEVKDMILLGKIVGWRVRTS